MIDALTDMAVWGLLVGTFLACVIAPIGLVILAGDAFSRWLYHRTPTTEKKKV